MSVRDQCGWVGQNYTDAVIPVAPGGLSTLSFSSYFNIAYGADTGVFDPAVPQSCWTYGAADPVVTSRLRPDRANPESSTWWTTTYYTEGSPYWPFLVPPVEMTEWDPVWKKSCRYWHTAGDEHFAPNFGVFDPVSLTTIFAAMLSKLIIFYSLVCSRLLEVWTQLLQLLVPPLGMLLGR